MKDTKVQDKKNAEAISHSEVEEYLVANYDYPCFVVGRKDNSAVYYWHSSDGLVPCVIDDQAMNEACINYLSQNGLVFPDKKELEACMHKSKTSSRQANGRQSQAASLS